MRLFADGWPSGYDRHVLSEVDSTNLEAARRVKDLTAPTWFLAGFQTGGRGRRGRPWVSPRGNFHATLAMRPTGGPQRAALRSFTAALSLHEALSALTGLQQAPNGMLQPLALKWPNDVLLNGGKVSGILLESLGSAGQVDHLAIGIGVNLIAAPDPALVEAGALRPVSVLAETGVRIAPDRLLTALAAAFARWEARFEAEGFAPLRAAWLDRAARLGQEIRVRSGSADRWGIFDGIDADGALILRSADGLHAIPAADVYWPDT